MEKMSEMIAEQLNCDAETAMEHIPEYLRVSQAERERAEREKEQKPAGTKI